MAAHDPWLDRWAFWRSDLAETLSVWIRRIRDRRDLAKLDDHELADLGISRAQANFEGEKPFWSPWKKSADVGNDGASNKARRRCDLRNRRAQDQNIRRGARRLPNG